jgi:hypothetical protein
MNIIHQTGSSRKSAACRRALSVAFVAAAPLCAFAASTDGQDPDAFKADVSHAEVTKMDAYKVEESATAKTHTLFMGADIAINLDKDLYKVKDVFGSNWVIDIKGEQKEISSKQAPVNLKITPTLKLTEVSATIVGFKKEQGYTEENDPSVRLTRGMNQAASMNADLLAMASNAQHIADTSASKNSAGQFAGADDQFSANAMMTTAKYAYSNSHATTTNGAAGPNASNTAPTATTNTTGANIGTDGTQLLNQGITEGAASSAALQTANGNEPTGRIATMGFDALDVEFDIRSAKPLRNPYVVTMTRFRQHGAKTSMVQSLVYAEALHPIDEHLSHVKFSERGFPFGYEIVDFQLHIYNRGEEVATNVASDRVELTREEAFEYVKMEYIGAHPKDTLPATPAMGHLPADLPAQLAAGKYAGAFYVRVSKDGLAKDAYSDSACTKTIDDAYLVSVVRRIRFKPALNNGKPVDSVASIKLGQLAI